MALNGFDGNGNFLRTFPEGGWKGDATAGIKIRADRHDDHDQALANALSNMICKDGQTTVLADIPFNGRKITGLGTPTAPTDAVNKAYADSVNTFTTGANISGADLNGRLTFTSATGANGIGWTGADLSWIARLATAAGPGTPPVPAATINRLVLNDKADGTGTDVIECREDGSLVTTGAITATTSVNVTGTAGNAHYWFKGPADEDRGVIYTDVGGANSLNIRNASGHNFSFDTAGGFTVPGSISVGNTVTASQLTSNAHIYAAGNITASGAINANSGSIDGCQLTNGSIVVATTGYKPGGGSWTATSDIRIKDVHGDYEHGLAELLQVNPVRYAYKASPDTEYIGVVAQDIEGVFPETVKQIEGEIDGAVVTDLRAFDSSALVFALINACKELSARIEALEAK